MIVEIHVSDETIGGLRRGLGIGAIVSDKDLAEDCVREILDRYLSPSYFDEDFASELNRHYNLSD